MKRNLILMSALFAGSMIVNDGFGGFKGSGKARGNSQAVSSSSTHSPMEERRPARDASSNTPNTPMLQQTPAQTQNTQQSQPVGDTQPADIPLNNVGGGSTSASVHGLPIPEEDDDVMRRSHSTPPVVGGGDIFQNLDGHQDVSEEPYVEYPNSPNLGNETRTSVRRNAGTGGVDTSSNDENKKSGRLDENTESNSREDGSTDNTANVNPVDRMLTSYKTSNRILSYWIPNSKERANREEEWRDLVEDLSEHIATINGYTSFFISIRDVAKIMPISMGGKYDNQEVLGQIMATFAPLRDGRPSPTGSVGQDRRHYSYYYNQYNQIVTESDSINSIFKYTAKQVGKIIGTFVDEDTVKDDNKYKLLFTEIYKIIEKEAIVHLRSSEVFGGEGIDYTNVTIESGDCLRLQCQMPDVNVKSLVVFNDDPGRYNGIMAGAFESCILKIFDVLKDQKWDKFIFFVHNDEHLNDYRLLIDMSRSIMTEFLDARERFQKNRRFLFESYFYTLKNSFLDFFEQILRSINRLEDIRVKTNSEGEQLKFLRRLESRICDRDNNTGEIQNKVMQDVFNVVSRRIEQEEARIREDNAPNDPEVYPVNGIMYSRGTLDDAKNELNRIYGSIGDNQKKVKAYTYFGDIITSLDNLGYENAAEAGAEWAVLLKDIDRLVLRSDNIKAIFRETDNRFLRNNLRKL